MTGRHYYLLSVGLALSLVLPEAASAEPCAKLETPEARFAELPEFAFSHRTVDLAWGSCTAQMSYVDEGPRDGKPVLLLHGQPSWSFMYRSLIQHLAQQGFRVIAPDLIGYGRSSKFTDPDAYDYARHRESIAALIRKLDLNDTTLVVHDWGGLIGLPIVAQDQQRFSRLVLFNTSLNDGSDPESASFKAGFDRWIEMLRTTPLVEADKVIAAQSAGLLPPDVLAAYMAPYPDGRFQSGLRRMSALIPHKPSDAGAAENARARRLLEGWTKPVLIAFSEDSERLHPGQFARFTALFSKSLDLRQTRIAGTKHFLLEDKPDEISKLVISFVKGEPAHANSTSQAADSLGSLSGERLYTDVKQFADFGEQRTGGAASAKTLNWIENRLTSLGYRTRRTAIPVTYHDVESAVLELPGSKISDGFPLWQPSWTGTGGLEGALRPLAEAGPDDVAIVHFPFSPIASIYDPSYRPIIAQLKERRPRAVVGITEHPSGEAVALNVREADDVGLNVPFLIVGQKHAAALGMAASRGDLVRIAITGHSMVRADANLVAERGLPDAAAIVISTPKNGWFTAGGERGPGIATALGLAEWLASTQPDQAVRLVFTSHHELGGQGMKAALGDPAFAQDRVRLWLHLGANIATRDVRFDQGALDRSDRVSPYRSINASDDLVATLQSAFNQRPGVTVKSMKDGRAIGEARLIAQKGFDAVVGIAGYQLLHHTRMDDAQSVAPAHLEATAVALTRFLATVE